MTTAVAEPRSVIGATLLRVPLVGFFARLVGPAALTAAGMIGAGAVATRLLAGAAIFLASRAADYVHGHVLVVDGGWLSR